MASITERGGRFCVRWRDAGGRGAKAHQITVSTRRRAEALAEEIERAIERDGVYEPGRPSGPTALGVVLMDFISDSHRRHAEGTTTLFMRRLDMFRQWVGDVPVSALSWQLLSDYHTHLQSPEARGRNVWRPRGPNTLHAHFQAVEGVWRWAWQRQARGVYHGVPQPDSLGLQHQPPPHRVAPTWAQMDAAIACARGWQRPFFVLMRCTGLRQRQALHLRWSDVDLDADPPILHLRPELGKSRQERRGRYMPIAPVLVAEMAGWGVREGYVVPCDRASRVAIGRDGRRTWKRAGVPEEVWRGCPHHAFRAGFQSGLKRLRADTEAVRYLVGHSRDLREHYVGPDALPLVETVGLVPEIDRDNVRRLKSPSRAREGGR